MIRLVAALRERGVRFARFNGETGFDLVVPWATRATLVTVLDALDFRRACRVGEECVGAVVRYSGFDREARRLVHLRVHSRLYPPFEHMLLDEVATECADIPTCRPEADLLFMVVRTILAPRDIGAVRPELARLRAAMEPVRMEAVLAHWAPLVPPALFHQALQALVAGSAWSRFTLRWRFRALFPATPEPAEVAAPALVMAPGGIVVAVIGGEASGKTTLTTAIADMFGPAFQVERVHMGKPKRCLPTAAALMAIKSAGHLRRLLRGPSQRTAQCAGNTAQLYAPHPVVAVLDAIDRFLVARDCMRRAARGTLVVTDRYPNQEPGGVEGPTIRPIGRLTTLLSRIERAIYRRVPDPDLVLVLTSPLEVAVARNSARPIPDPDDFVRDRHWRITNARFGLAPTIQIDTSQPLEPTKDLVRDLVWRHWGGTAGR